MLLQEFLRRYAKVRGLYRPHKGPSIVPLAIVDVAPLQYRLATRMLITYMQRDQALFYNRDLTKIYNMGGHLDYLELEYDHYLVVGSVNRLTPMGNGLIHLNASFVAQEYRNDFDE